MKRQGMIVVLKLKSCLKLEGRPSELPRRPSNHSTAAAGNGQWQEGTNLKGSVLAQTDLDAEIDKF